MKDLEVLKQECLDAEKEYKAVTGPYVKYEADKNVLEHYFIKLQAVLCNYKAALFEKIRPEIVDLFNMCQGVEVNGIRSAITTLLTSIVKKYDDGYTARINYDSHEMVYRIVLSHANYLFSLSILPLNEQWINAQEIIRAVSKEDFITKYKYNEMCEDFLKEQSKRKSELEKLVNQLNEEIKKYNTENNKLSGVFKDIQQLKLCTESYY